MRVVARAPGKLVVLGEYAVLAGAPALVVAVDRYCRAEITASDDSRCHLTTAAPQPRQASFPPGSASGAELVDRVVEAWPAGSSGPWRGTLDSGELYGESGKLGLGSSAAALTAWAGAWASYARGSAVDKNPATLQVLIGLHRAFQGGCGSGLDVAASLFGGAIRYRLTAGSEPQVGSVRLPKSVGFLGVFAGHSASTPDLLARYGEWRQHARREADRQLRAMGETARAGCKSAEAGDGVGFLEAVAEYGQQLERLGESMGGEIMTDAHRKILGHATRFGVVYKVSGAGGGDLGLACSADREALEAFKVALDQRYQVIEVGLDNQGLTVEERERG
jgi:phosphomevalonate kinase